MTEEGFDLFSGATVKVASSRDQEQTRADYIQLAAASRMGDVPLAQLAAYPQGWIRFRAVSIKEFLLHKFDLAWPRTDQTIFWTDEADDFAAWRIPKKFDKRLLDWPKPFARMQTVEVKAWIASPTVKQEILPTRIIEARVWERDRDWRLK